MFVKVPDAHDADKYGNSIWTIVLRNIVLVMDTLRVLKFESTNGVTSIGQFSFELELFIYSLHSSCGIILVYFMLTIVQFSWWRPYWSGVILIFGLQVSILSAIFGEVYWEVRIEGPIKGLESNEKSIKRCKYSLYTLIRIHCMVIWK